MGSNNLLRREDFGPVDLSDVVEPDAPPLPLVHPGDILRHDFLVPLGLSANALALALRVSPNRITAILNGQRAISAETALRLARHFGTTAGFWLNLQKNYELESAERELGERIRAEVAPRVA